MEPSFDTAAELRGVMQELRASGKRYSREFVLHTLQTRAVDPTEASWVVRDFQVREIAADNHLATYTLLQGARISRRSTLWRHTGSGWQILYHQGTLAAAHT